ncbi:MAG TPA: winged helix-turn-helix domain-containing protein [Feifaniaceae bacterium]|nr:winged helix-turn-helix domain-containing protein [Feifaniaceae bacterium]
MDTIVLSGKKELDIYINPQRQKLLRCMKIAGVPMNPKQLSDQIGISASAVQHHIKKLVELGIVELDHTARIRGITASYYKVLPRTVSIGGMLEDGNTEQRFALMQNSINAIFSGFSEYCKSNRPKTGQDVQHGEMLSGVIHLTREEAKELYGVIRAFLDSREEKKEETIPWEFALIAYPAAEAKDA